MNRYPGAGYEISMILVAGIGESPFLESRENPVYLVPREHTHQEQPQSTMGYRWVAVAASTNASGDFYKG